VNKRELFAQFSNYSGLISLTNFLFNNSHLRGPLLRAVNYHRTLSASKSQLARHFEYYCRNFNVLGEEDLPKFLKGELKSTQPNLVITFDDASKSNYDVAAKLLDEFGIKGIFFLPISFIDQSQQSLEVQKKVYLTNINLSPEGDPSPEEYQPMSWDEVKDLVARGHAVGSHTFSHCSLREGLSEETLEHEIVYSKKILEERVKVKVMSFCWAFGETGDYSRAAYDLVRKHYNLAFTTFASPLRVGGNPYTIDRSNVEASMSLAWVKCATQGITELYFSGRRKSFERLVC